MSLPMKWYCSYGGIGQELVERARSAGYACARRPSRSASSARRGSRSARPATRRNTCRARRECRCRNTARRARCPSRRACCRLRGRPRPATPGSCCRPPAAAARPSSSARGTRRPAGRQPGEQVLGLPQLGRGTGQRRVGVDEVGRRVRGAADFARVAVLVLRTALRARALDVAVGEEHPLDRGRTARSSSRRSATARGREASGRSTARARRFPASASSASCREAHAYSAASPRCGKGRRRRSAARA